MTNTRPLSRGRRRMQELAVENAAKRQEIATRILAELGRPPLAVDVIAAENLAALHVKADQIEAAGRNAAGIRKMIIQAQRASFKPSPPTPAKPESLEEYLARTAQVSA